MDGFEEYLVTPEEVQRLKKTLAKANTQKVSTVVKPSMNWVPLREEDYRFDMTPMAEDQEFSLVAFRKRQLKSREENETT